MFRQVCTIEPSFFKTTWGDASSALRGSTSSFIDWLYFMLNLTMFSQFYNTFNNITFDVFSPIRENILMFCWINLFKPSSKFLINFALRNIIEMSKIQPPKQTCTCALRRPDFSKPWFCPFKVTGAGIGSSRLVRVIGFLGCNPTTVSFLLWVGISCPYWEKHGAGASVADTWPVWVGLLTSAGAK